MLTRHLALALLAATIALGTAAASAQTRHDNDGVRQQQLQTRKPVARAPRAVGTKIACPKGGCIRIPANCVVTMEENWDGGPTGNELIACP